MANTFELILNDITDAESQLPFYKDFGHYKSRVTLFLNQLGKYLFKEDILLRYSNQMTLEKVFEQEPERFIQGPNRKKGDKMEITWYDLWAVEPISPEGDFFDFFFACKLRHLSLLEVGNFLEYHLNYSFHNDKAKYLNFLTLLPMQQVDLLNPQLVETVRIWINQQKTLKDSDSNLQEADEKIKGRKAREAGDKLTVLNLNQTALLVQYMQQAGLILQGDYLTFSQAGKAFNILTGYSANTIRQQLGTKGEIEGVKHEDYQELHRALKHLLELVEPKVRKK